MRATDALPGTALARTVVVGVIAAALGWGSASGAAAAPTPTPSSSSKAEAVANGSPAAAPGGTFSSSFEEGQPQPVESTVEAGRNGPRQKNVTGNQGTDGSLLGAVVGITASAENTPGEVAANLTDDNPDTKWLAFESTGWVRYQLSAAKKAVTYSLTSANDSPERDPKDLTLQGSADGTTWTDLDRQTGLDFAERFETKSFTIATPGSYPYYRLDVTAIHERRHRPARRLGPQRGPGGQPAGHLADGHRGRRRTPVRVQHQVARRVDGRQGAALRRAATPPTGGATPGTACSTSTSRSGQSSQLSYKVIPDMVKGDLKYPSTYAAIDLRFTDGSYLSDLGATDSHHTAFSPQRAGPGQDPVCRAVELRGRRPRAAGAGQDHRRDPAGLRQHLRSEGRDEVRWLGRRRHHRPRTRRKVDRTQSVELRRRPTRHQRVGLVLARQQPADQRPAQRVHLLHPADRRELPVVGVLVPGGEQRDEPPRPPGSRHLARAVPVDG